MGRPEWTDEMYETMDCAVEVVGKLERAGQSYWAVSYQYGNPMRADGLTGCRR